MLKIIVIAVVVLLAVFLAYAATKPDIFRVERAISIKAPQEKIFALINDFHRWGSWSPWEKLDAAMKKTHSGAASGKGAVYEWEGNSKVGAGRMEITDISPASRVIIKLDFIRPFEGHNVAEFTLAPQSDSINVTWAMHGPNRYMSKLMSIFMDMDRLIGKDFEAGLTNLKTIAEQ